MRYRKKRKSALMKALIGIEIAIICAVLALAVREVIGGNNKENNKENNRNESVQSARPIESRLTAASMDHSAWIIDGKLRLAGEEYEGQAEVSEWDNLVQVSISDHHVLALNQDGIVYAAGSNANLQCEINGLENVCYIEACMNGSAAVLEDGTVQLFGIVDEAWRDALLGEENVRSLAIGDCHAVVLHHDGTVTAYGQNDCGQCEVKEWKGIWQIAVGYAFTAGLKENGKIVLAGDESCGPENVQQWEKMVQIDAGSGFLTGIDEAGKVFASGQNRQGQCNVNAWSGIVSAAAGYDHTIGLNDKGEAFAIGFNGSGQCEI